MLRRFHWWPFLLILVGFTASVYALIHRHSVEAGSRSVALVLDHGQLRSLISATGVPPAEAYRRFKSAGITGVALTEETLADLVSEGVLQVTAAPAGAGAREYRVEIQDPAVAARIAEYVPRLVRGATEQAPQGDRIVLPGLGGGKIYIPGRFDDIRSAPTGLDEVVGRELREAGFEVVGRIANPLGLTAESLRWELERVKGLGIHTVIFSGEEVLGYSELVPQTAQDLRELGLLYGSIEFGKQRGDERLSQLMEDRLVRVHSISSAEMPRLTVPEAIERYVRAAAERNIRLNYVRLPATVTGNTFEDSVDYVADLSRRTVEAHFGLGTPQPFEPVWPPLLGRLVRALIGLGIGAGAALLLAGLVPLSRRVYTGLVIAASAGCAGVAFLDKSLGHQAVALLSAVVFPTLAFVLIPQPVGAFEEHKHSVVRERRLSILAVLAEFAFISAVTLVGAFMLAGLLSQLPYMVKTKSFAGIKVATVVPIILVGWIYLTGMSGEYPSWRSERDAMTYRLREFFSEPLRIWHILAFVAAVVALYLLVERSGNDSGVGVSATELRFRALLDRYLVVRPRTKEFMLGHPALLLALAMSARPRWRAWALPLLLVGIIGQVGMLNSFCHLHTPIKITLIRTFNGLLFGVLLGAVLTGAWLLVERMSRTPVRARG